MKTNGENGTAENENETKTESESLKTEEKPTHSSKTEPTHSPTTQASLLASMAEAQNGLENKSNLISETIKNFGLDRFTGNPLFIENRPKLRPGAKNRCFSQKPEFRPLGSEVKNRYFSHLGSFKVTVFSKLGLFGGEIEYDNNCALSCLNFKFSKNKKNPNHTKIFSGFMSPFPPSMDGPRPGRPSGEL